MRGALRSSIAAVSGILAGWFACQAPGQTITQTVNLRPGWNAVYLEVQPPDPAPDVVFRNLPVASAWTHQERLSSANFIQNPSEEVFNRAGWLGWFPTNSPAAFLRNLHAVNANRAYLIKNTNSTAVNWVIAGRPSSRPTAWVSDAYNLRGFAVPAVNPPSFLDFFRFSPAHFDSGSGQVQSIYRLDTGGQWTLVKSSDPMRRGEAVWVFSKGASDYAGPVEVHPQAGTEADFDAATEELILEFKNRTPSDQMVTLALRSPTARGALAYRVFGPASGGYRWPDFPAQHTLTIAANATELLRLGIRRSAFSTSYSALLEITDSAQTQYLPVTATKPFNDSAQTLQGLWVGGATVSAVSEANRDPTNVTPAQAGFPLRLLVHVDADGNARFLKEVLQMWRDGTYTNDASGNKVVDKPGEYVLLTDERLIGQFKGVTLRDGVPVGQRISTAGFDFDGGATNYLNMNGTFAVSNRLALIISLGAEFPHQPFPTFNLIEGLNTVNVRGKLVFVDLPYSIRSRLLYDPLNKNLTFSGLLNEAADYGGPDNPLLLVNVMTVRERERIKVLDGVQPPGALSEFDRVIDALFDLTRNPNRLDVNRDGQPDRAWLVGLDYEYVTNRIGNSTVVITNIAHERLDDRPKVLSAAPGTGSGYITVVQNDDRRLAGLPVSLTVLRVEGGPYLGDLKVLLPDNVFDEKLTLRHSADFGGVPENLEFEWYYQPATDTSVRTNLPFSEGGALNLNGWRLLDRGLGLNDITIGDGTTSTLLTLSDNYFICRYRGYEVNGETNWSGWVGVIGGGQAQLAPGWIKRVILGLNPFEARTRDFHESPTATYASMIQQAGSRYEGDIAFNPSADNLNKIGLISAYETVLRRGRRLSIDSAEQINEPAANNALLLAAGRIADFYMLLGNEAYADAADPTIGFRTDQAGYGTLAPCIFTFQNQLDSLLEEELALLRGRDDSSATVKAPPVYNRLFWNFTKGEGEVAYSQTYNISDQNGDGVVNAEDARIMYPQGHGDAWGHYLTATKTYYGLLRSPNYAWEPRAEDILLAGVPVKVDYLDERKFASAASAKAKTGAEIVDLTYRLQYVDDPAGQYQGYKDTSTDRAWGVSEWARRAGQGAYFDWAVANAILPANDPDPGHIGIEKIDRTTVQELGQIIADFNTVQSQLDKADAGLNPLGLAKNVVPFDIDPNLIGAGKTHFEQIYDRALDLMANAGIVFNHANQLSQSLRALQDTVDNFTSNAQQQERDYKNRLIEVFGYPYAGDIGPGGTYPSGYDGPDLYHYMYVNTVELNGDTAPPSQTFTAFYSAIQAIDRTRPGTTFDFIFGSKDFFFPTDVPTDPGDRFTNEVLEVSYPFTPSDFGFAAPAGWGQRRAPGEIQLALSEMVQAHARLKRAQLNYDNLLAKVRDQIDLLQARYNVAQETVRIRDKQSNQSMALDGVILGAKATQRLLNEATRKIEWASEILIEGFPKVVGIATDVFSAQRSIVKGLAFSGTTGLAAGAIVAEGVALAAEEGKSKLEDETRIEIESQGFSYEVRQQFKVLEDLLRQEAVLRVEAFELAQALEQCSGRYQAAVAKGLRLAEDRAAFRARMAAQTQENRYRDMTFRIFRNDAIQKYRAQFDLTAQYVFLAAVAYDFETQLLGGDNGAGREFLTDIIRQRSLGQMENGVPMAGRHGLADPLARLGQNFFVLKGQMGFNNPQTETGRFSLRNEFFRLGTNSPAEWQAELKKHIVANVWDIPEFRRYCRPFAPESAGAQPALVIRFPTTVTFGLNYFGWPLGGGDSAYDPSLFATKVRSVGVWFKDYNGSGLSVTPRVYLVPVGADVLRSPSGIDLQTREWRVIDQKIPVPFPIGYTSMQDPAWIPANNSLSDTLAEIRRFSSFRAYHDSGFFTPAEVISDSRLIGRSVWNTEWLLIIPGGTFLFDPNQGLDTFIRSVSDIKIFFQTYAYSGN